MRSTGSAIEIPAPGARVTLPLHVLAHVGQPRERVVVTLRWRDGTTLALPFTTLRGADGRGLLIASLDWTNEVGPLPQPRTQPAILELRTRARALLARQQVTVVSPRDPATRKILLYWVLGAQVYRIGQPRYILRTPRIGTAALQELLWGPGPRNFAGFTTALPTPQQVLSYPGRRSDWGPRVTVRSLSIRNGVAWADFSREMQSYGGGSLRVSLIYRQISATLAQFPTVRQVCIAIDARSEGCAGILQP
jgi:hypothetical protein